MKYSLLAILLLSVLSCGWMERFHPLDVVTFEISSSDEIHVITSKYDYGYIQSSSISENYYQETEYNYFIQCYSDSPITLTIYLNGTFVYSETGTLIYYNNN